MPDIYRPSVQVGACTTLDEKSRELGGTASMLRKHKMKSPHFPKAVARFGNAHLYVSEELDAFYKSVQWKQADQSIRELTGEPSWDNS